MIKGIWYWLDARNQAYTFLECLFCVIYLYTMASPAFEAWRTEIMVLTVVGFTFIGARSAMKSVKKTMVWLLVTPFVCSLPLIAYFANSWNDVSANFNIALIVVVTATILWGVTAWLFDEEKTKMAMSMLNDIFRYILAFSLAANWYQYPGMFMEFAKYFGMMPGAVIEASIKIVTLPYVLAGVAGMFILNLRQWKIM